MTTETRIRDRFTGEEYPTALETARRQARLLGYAIPELDPEEVAEGARELSWRHPEARGGRS